MTTRDVEGFEDAQENNERTSRAVQRSENSLVYIRLPDAGHFDLVVDISLSL